MKAKPNFPIYMAPRPQRTRRQLPSLIRNQTDTEAEIFIYADIGDSFFGEGISSSDLVRDLKSLSPSIQTINVRINSQGGNAFEGIAMYNALIRHPAKVVAFNDAIAASAASLVLMAGEEIVMAQNAQIMVHNPAAMMFGGAEEFRQAAEHLDQVRDVAADIYVARTGVTVQQATDMMAVETWLTADEALELGFADRVTENLAVAAHIDASRFVNVPRQLNEPPSTEYDLAALRDRMDSVLNRASQIVD